MRTFISILVVAAMTGTSIAQDKPEPKAAQGSGLTGGVSEEEFKALHQLKEGAVAKLEGQMIDVKGAGKAYLTLPKDGKPGMPAVIVIHEWWGLNDNVKHWSDRLAALGYAALAVDLYDGKVTTTPDDAMKAMKAVDADKSRVTLKAAHEFLVTDPRIKAGKTASIGWCFGGHWSLETAIAVPELDACVIYYGTPITDVAVLGKIKAPILGVFGKQDPSINPKVVEGFSKALDEAKIPHTFHSYDAPHAFANPSNPKYDEKSAADAFEKVRAFLAAKMKS